MIWRKKKRFNSKTVLLLDNYDSFTYIIRDYLLCLGVDVRVLTPADIEGDQEFGCFAGVIVSPGPGHPADSRVSMDTVERCVGEVPLLGVCLGMQCLALSFGGRVVVLNPPVHAGVSIIKHCGGAVFSGIPETFRAARYHSLVVAGGSLDGSGLRVSAVSCDGQIMAVENPEQMVYGVQFHPESIASEYGMSLFANFVNLL